MTISRTHMTVTPRVLYVGTPVMLLSTIKYRRFSKPRTSILVMALGKLLVLGLETERTRSRTSAGTTK